MNDKELISNISKLLWNEDLMGIGKGINSPKDEFYGEAKQIAIILKQCDYVEDFTEKLINIFNDSFEPIPPLVYDDVVNISTKLFELKKS